MSKDEIWEFDNGIAYDLCRIICEDPLTAIHNGGGAYLISKSEHWTKVGEAVKPLKWTSRNVSAKTPRHNPS